jgi:hypothetical protein
MRHQVATSDWSWPQLINSSTENKIKATFYLFLTGPTLKPEVYTSPSQEQRETGTIRMRGAVKNTIKILTIEDDPVGH